MDDLVVGCWMMTMIEGRQAFRDGDQSQSANDVTVPSQQQVEH